ncbi:MAG: hypothetical protein RL318_2423, partial [Fibrobacterota bacterium]
GFQSEEKLGVQFPAFRKKLLIGLALNTYTREQTERVIFSEESSMYSRRPEEGNYDYSYGILGSTLSIEYPLPPFRFGTTLGLSYCIVEEMEGNADSWYSWDHIARVSAPLCTEGEILPSAKVSLIWSW